MQIIFSGSIRNDNFIHYSRMEINKYNFLMLNRQRYDNVKLIEKALHWNGKTWI